MKTLKLRKPSHLNDFTQALEEGTRETRVWFLRAEARAALHRAADAAADQAEGKRREPGDDVSYITRAMVRSADGDVSGGLADLDEALRINPRSYAALMNKANLLDEKLHREADAVLDRLIECHPQALVGRSGRVVLLARLGRREEARADAAYCLAREPEPVVRYQLAGVFAHLSSQEPSDAATAFRLLRSALRAGAGHEWLAIDPDLAPIRSQKEFHELSEAVRILAPSNKK